VGWRTSVDITVPVFTRHRAGVLVEDSELTHLRAERDARAAEIRGAVAAALARATAARLQVTRYQTNILPNLAEVEQMAQDAYTAGQTNLAALLEQLRSARDVRQRGLDASLAYQQALADLEQAMGTRLR
jgi:outer membrane protein TolC